MILQRKDESKMIRRQARGKRLRSQDEDQVQPKVVRMVLVGATPRNPRKGFHQPRRQMKVQRLLIHFTDTKCHTQSEREVRGSIEGLSKGSTYQSTYWRYHTTGQSETERGQSGHRCFIVFIRKVATPQ